MTITYSLILSLSLSGEFPDLVPMLLRFHCGLHSERHMDMNQVPPVPPNQDLNPLLLQIKNRSELEENDSWP